MFHSHAQYILRPRLHRLSVPNKPYRLGGIFARHYTGNVDYETKYAEKLHRLAAEKGLSVSELRETAKKSQEEEMRRRRQEREEQMEQMALRAGHRGDSSDKPMTRSSSAFLLDKTRQDSSPVKPLSNILNLTRVFSTPHTAEQIAHLWNAFHMSRSGGTGRGFLSASIPLDLYNKMTAVAEKYPTFIVPIRRAHDDVSAPSTKGEKDSACEFYFLQWDFHGLPPMPTADSFAKVPTSGEDNPNPNPKLSTVLFTPLEEYKLRNTFATPYLVLTNYTDLASTHSQVLLRGEITPRSNSGKYMLSQEDAQQLSMAVQKFYLWGDGGGEGERLLRIFHEKPKEFKWEDLLKMADWHV